jgi:hypothetical protein
MAAPTPSEFIRILFSLGLFHPLVVSEIVTTILLFYLAVICFRMRWIAVVEGYWVRFSRRPMLPLFTIFALPVALRVALLISDPRPAPYIYDEFANLLLGDTFAHWRLSNPTHPFWIHFETFQTIQHPQYYCFRPPVPGIFLALLEPLVGSAWNAVCVSMGLMCAAILWMLRGWLPPRWALLGALLATMQIGVLSYWMNTYWGGQWAALGGALLLGGLGRLLRFPRARDAVLMALGSGLIVNTRPLEGLAVALAAACVIGVRLLSGNAQHRPMLFRALVPGLVTLGLIVGAMLYYNLRLTGSAFVTPYQLGVQTYNWAPQLAWQRLGPRKLYNHEAIRGFYEGWELMGYENWKSEPLVESLIERLAETGQFFVRPALGLALVAFPWVVLRDRKIRPLLWICLVMVPVILASVWYNPHYVAPVTSAFYAILVQGIRHLRIWSRRGGVHWVAIARVIPIACALTLCIAMAMDVTGGLLPSNFRGWCGRYPQLRRREEIRSRLSALAERQLILVRYAPGHDPVHEWVYNDADIDAAKIVWAREMDSTRNSALLKYFQGRTAWLLEADLKPPRLSPYPGQ